MTSFGFLVKTYSGLSLGKIQSGSLPDSIFLVVILAPFLETIFIQYIPYTMIVKRRNIKTEKPAYLAVSSVLFGLIHWYHIYFVIVTIIGGFFLSNRFFQVSIKRNELAAIISIFTIHAVSNLISTFMIKLGL